MKPIIVFRVDGGTSIGMGHLIRCLALAEMLKNDFSIEFAIQTEDEALVSFILYTAEQLIGLPITNNYTADARRFSELLDEKDIVVLDGYHFKTEYQQAIKNRGSKLVVIDDLHSWHQVADVVINHAEGVPPSAYSKEDYTTLCLGLDYVLLRKPFLKPNSKPRKITAVKKVFISMGAADVNNITQKFTEALLQIKGIEEIHLMLGAINPNLKQIEKLIAENKQINIIQHFNISAEELADILKQCDVSICPASSISLESCAIGIGLISGYTAENQLGNLLGMEKRKTLINFGDMNLLTVDEIKQRLSSVFIHPEQLNDLIENQAKMIDGKSPERLVKVFKGLAKQKNNNNLHFRFANENDTELYFDWANDELVRENSFNKEPILLDNHVKWFQSKLQSKDCFFYLFLTNENKPVGQVRIDKSDDEIIIGISIDEKYRGKSLGSILLKMASDDYLSKHPTTTITAYIKKENTASLNIFMKAGFSIKETVTVHNSESYKLYKKLTS